MNARELRIGNVIWDESRLKIKFVNHRVINDLASHNNPLPYIPILITEEWMVKFGFIGEQNYLYKHWKVMNDIFYSYIDKNGAFHMFSKVLPNIDRVIYVHQFQNLYFALMGEEIQIK